MLVSILCVAKDGLQLLDPAPPENWDHWCMPRHTVLCGAEVQTQGFLYAGQALCQLGHISPGKNSFFISHLHSSKPEKKGGSRVLFVRITYHSVNIFTLHHDKGKGKIMGERISGKTRADLEGRGRGLGCRSSVSWPVP